MTTYVLSLLHFNAQYCAGGLEGFYDNWPLDNTSLEDQMVVESFEPVLGMLEAHPTWQMDLELQAYMVEILAQRHPDTLDRLRVLADAGQVEIVSFHYSDQLWTAFPWRDQEVSLDETRRIFETYDLPLSPVVFTQEGQFGEGMLRRMPEFGYSVAVLPGNLASYLWGTEPGPLYRFDDVTVVAGTWGAGEGWTVEWDFLNDGELYATNDMNCYLGPAFVYDPDALARKEAGLAAREAAGATIASIGRFAADRAGDAIPLPPVVDGTWQPDDTDNLFRWMGGSGLWGADEADNEVRTTNVAARHAVAAAEQVPGADADTIALAWREVLLAEVSDATGWNPYPTEVQYARDHSQAAVDAAVDAIGEACADAGADAVVVDVATGAVDWDGELPDVGGAAADPAFGLVYDTRVPAESWVAVDTDVTALTLTFPASEEPAVASFPWDGTTIAVVPALLDEVVSLDATAIAADPLGLPLSAGLVRLSEGRWLVEDTQRVHLAALLSRSAGTVTFHDDTADDGEVTWRFLVLDGDEARALALARATNFAPPVRLECPPAEVGGADGACGCAAGGGGSVAGLVGALAAVWRRRLERAHGRGDVVG